MDRRPKNLNELKAQLIKLSEEPNGLSLVLRLFDDDNSSRLMRTAAEFATTEPRRSFLDEILNIGFGTLTEARPNERPFLIKRLRTAIRAALGDFESVAIELIQPHGLEIDKMGRLTFRSDDAKWLYGIEGPQGGPSLDDLYQELVASNPEDVLKVFDAVNLMLNATTFTPRSTTAPIGRLLSIGFQNLIRQHTGEGRMDYIQRLRRSIELLSSGNKGDFILENLLGGKHRGDTNPSAQENPLVQNAETQEEEFTSYFGSNSSIDHPGGSLRPSRRGTIL